MFLNCATRRCSRMVYVSYVQSLSEYLRYFDIMIIIMSRVDDPRFFLKRSYIQYLSRSFSRTVYSFFFLNKFITSFISIILIIRLFTLKVITGYDNRRTSRFVVISIKSYSVEINISNATVLKVHEEILHLKDAYEF